MLLGQKVVSPLTVLPFWVLGLPLLVAVSLELVFQLFLLVSPLPSVLLPVLVYCFFLWFFIINLFYDYLCHILIL